jgi:hypothetical protein
MVIRLLLNIVWPREIDRRASSFCPLPVSVLAQESWSVNATGLKAAPVLASLSRSLMPG